VAEVSFERYGKPIRQERVLDEMNRCHCAVLSQARGSWASAGGGNRMLRIHCLQQWFTLSDPAVEEALDDSRAMRGLVGIDLEREPVPDATTICTFRHLLEAHQVSAQLVAWIQEYLVAARLDDEPGTIVDAPASLLPARRRISCRNEIRTCTRRRRTTSGPSA